MHVGKNLFDAIAMLLKRSHERGGDVDPAAVQLQARERHIREMHQSGILSHIIILDGFSDLIPIEQHEASRLLNDLFGKRRLARGRQPEEPKRFALNFFSDQACHRRASLQASTQGNNAGNFFA
jgi:hypothetical protein